MSKLWVWKEVQSKLQQRKVNTELKKAIAWLVW